MALPEGPGMRPALQHGGAYCTTCAAHLTSASDSLHALLFGSAGVHEQLHLGADFGLDAARAFTLEDARHHAAGLLAQVAVVDADRPPWRRA